MDPVPIKMPEPICSVQDFGMFYRAIFEEMQRQGVHPGAVKPNQGFFSRYDRLSGELNLEGSRQLAKLIEAAKQQGYPVILDNKRGDIGPSSENYARELTNVYDADACTISPYMGTDSVEPFLKARAAYVLCRTSNPGGKELQNLLTIKPEELSQFGFSQGLYSMGDAIQKIAQVAKPLYLRVADKIIEWDALSPGNVGAVVGATNLPELEAIARHFVASGKTIPLLIPGVGKQGGSAKEVANILRATGYDLEVVRINQSGDLNYAWEKEGRPLEFAQASVRALKRLNDEIEYKRAA